MQAPGNLNAVLRVLQGAFTNGGIGIAERTEFVFLILKKIGINRARQNSVTLGVILDVVCTTHAAGAVPKNVQSDGRADSSQQVDLAGIAELLFRCRGSCGLDIFPETCPGVREAPRRQLDAKGFQRIEEFTCSL